MATETVNSIITPRTGTTAEWTASTYVPEKDELCYDSTANIFKMGDGTKKFTELPETPEQGGSSDFTTPVTVTTPDGFAQLDPTTLMLAKDPSDPLSGAVGINIDQGYMAMGSGYSVSLTHQGLDIFDGNTHSTISPNQTNGSVVASVSSNNQPNKLKIVASEVTLNGSMSSTQSPIKITNVAEPTGDTDVATKGYVDSHSGSGGDITAAGNNTFTGTNDFSNKVTITGPGGTGQNAVPLTLFDSTASSGVLQMGGSSISFKTKDASGSISNNSNLVVDSNDIKFYQGPSSIPGGINPYRMLVQHDGGSSSTNNTIEVSCSQQGTNTITATQAPLQLVVPNNPNFVIVRTASGSPAIIRNVATPEAPIDAATKQYVDDAVGAVSGLSASSDNTFTGSNTFSKPIISVAGTADNEVVVGSQLTELGNEVNTIANAYVTKDTSQVISGIKTFSSSPVVPTPTLDTQVANKAYVDSKAGGGSGDVTQAGNNNFVGNNVFAGETNFNKNVVISSEGAALEVYAKRTGSNSSEKLGFSYDKSIYYVDGTDDLTSPTGLFLNLGGLQTKKGGTVTSELTDKFLKISNQGDSIELYCGSKNSITSKGIPLYITNVAEPTAATDVATKGYVDSKISGSGGGTNFTTPVTITTSNDSTPITSTYTYPYSFNGGNSEETDYTGVSKLTIDNKISLENTLTSVTNPAKTLFDGIELDQNGLTSKTRQLRLFCTLDNTGTNGVTIIGDTGNSVRLAGIKTVLEDNDAVNKKYLDDVITSKVNPLTSNTSVTPTNSSVSYTSTSGATFVKNSVELNIYGNLLRLKDSFSFSFSGSVAQQMMEIQMATTDTNFKTALDSYYSTFRKNESYHELIPVNFALIDMDTMSPVKSIMTAYYDNTEASATMGYTLMLLEELVTGHNYMLQVLFIV